ncbi:hypothetical protein KIPB_015369, partial [Kipferlia bialata]|eukprot:g15369.t1
MYADLIRALTLGNRPARLQGMSLSPSVLSRLVPGAEPALAYMDTMIIQRN